MNDCVPAACHSTDSNIFRQVRDAGGTARTYVENAKTGCVGAAHPANVPALYYFGANDHSYCQEEVRPVPNLIVAPTAHEGALTNPVATHGAALRTIEEMLGLPVLRPVSATTSLRASAHI